MQTTGKWLVRFFLAVLVLIALGVGAVLVYGPGYVEAGRNRVVAHERYPVSAEAQALHDRLIVGDWHADPLLWNRDLTERGSYGQVDIPRLLEGGVALQVFTAVTKSPAGQNYEQNSAEAFDNVTPLAIGQLWPIRTWASILERAIYQAAKLEDFEARSGGQLRIIRTQEDLDAVLEARANGTAVVGGILGIEGAHPLEGTLENLDLIEAAGHRVIGLHHFFDNALGGSLHGESNLGLTEFGRAVIAEVEARGMILDLAHSSPQVARDAIEITNMPLIVSHTGIHSHCQVKRNFTDALMQQIAATGGVIGIGYWAEVACGQIDPAGIAAMILAGINVVGEDHISLGSDFDGSVQTAFDTSELPALTHALLQAGLTEDQITKVMGGNMVRVLRARLPNAR